MNSDSKNPNTEFKMLRHDYLKIVAIAVAYFLAHKIAFFFPDQEKVIMLVWPAGGVSLAAFLLNPQRLWPALTLAFYISGITADVLLAGRSFITGVGYMTGNMVESIGCAWLILHWSGGFRRFTQVKEILALIAGTIFVNALSSCIGAGTSVLTRGASFVDSWQSWYISDGLGVLVMGPFIVAWINIRDLIVRFRLKVLIEGLCFLIVWSVVIWLIFAPIVHPLHLRPYILIPLLAWPAIRFGQRGVTLALMVLFAMAIASPSILNGPSIWKMLSESLANRLLELQLFLVFSAGVGYLLSAGYADLIRADEELKRSAERLELALQGANEGIWDWNIATGYVSYSNLWVEMIGYKPGELKPDVGTWEQLLHPDDKNKTMEALNKHLEDAQNEYKAEFRLKCKDGSWKWIQALGKVFQRDTDGKPERMSGIHLDITERKLLEEEREQYFRFFQASTDLMVIADPNGAFMKTNPACKETLGYCEAELVSKPFIDFVHPDDKQSTLDEMARQLQKGFSLNFENRYICKDGSFKWLSWRANYSKDEGITYATARDITKQKHIEKMLQEMHNLLEDVQKLSKLGGWKFDKGTGHITWTDEVYRIYGVGKDFDPDDISKSISFYSPEDMQTISQAFEKAVNFGEPYDLELQFVRLNGEHIWVRTIGNPIMENGKVVSVTGNIMDITDRKLAEESIRQNEERLKVALGIINMAVFNQDQELRYIWMYRPQLGYTTDQIVGKRDSDLLPPDLAQQTTKLKLQVLETGAGRRGEIQGTWNDKRIYYDLIVEPLRNSAGQIIGITGASLDITERKLEAQQVANALSFSKAIVEASPLGVFTYKASGECLLVNKAAVEITGGSVEKLLKQNFHQIESWKKLGLLLAADEALRTGEIVRKEVHGVTTFGKEIWYEAYFKSFIINDESHLLLMLGNIIERKQAADQLQRKQVMLARTEAIAHVGSWEWDVATDTVTWSDELFRIFHLDPADGAPSFAEHPNIFHPEDMAQLKLAVEAAVSEGTPYELELRAIRTDGETRKCLVRGNVQIGPGGKAARLFGSLQDITERKRAEDVIKRSLEEKEVMLKEIHHRVKNNMQVISSLLSLQAKGVADSTVKAMLEESRNRVSSMSLVHEKLYQSKDLAYIDFKEYLQSLVDGIANTYKRHDVVISMEMEPVALDVNVGIPCGLIVNELVSNSLKHAFPEGRKGTISLGINKNSEVNYVLFVADNGIGFSAEMDFRKPSTLGLQLVNVLSTQINGKIERSQEEGTRFSITFPRTSNS
jgi:PAS domain S-box-containing protein